jgi:hypothetical protein
MPATLTLPDLRPLRPWETACTAASPANAARPYGLTREFHPDATPVGQPKQQRDTGYWFQQHRCPNCGGKFWTEGKVAH